jgi:hypothetical protein
MVLPKADEFARENSGDALSDPEPAVPSLPGPDPEIFHSDSGHQEPNEIEVENRTK